MLPIWTGAAIATARCRGDLSKRGASILAGRRPTIALNPSFLGVTGMDIDSATTAIGDDLPPLPLPSHHASIPNQDHGLG